MGGVHGAYQIIGDIIKPYKNKLYKRLKVNTEPFSFKLGQVLTTFALVTFAWIFFRAPEGAALSIIKRMLLHFNPGTLLSGELFALGLSRGRFLVLILSIFILLAGDFLQTKMNVRETLSRQNLVFRWAVYYFALLALVLLGSFGANQFIYFQF